MTSRDFCYWLQGFFELRGVDGGAMDPRQVEQVRKHLALVFKHEIDPSIDGGNPDKKKVLDDIHTIHPPQGVVYRC